MLNPAYKSTSGYIPEVLCSSALPGVGLEPSRRLRGMFIDNAKRKGLDRVNGLSCSGAPNGAQGPSVSRTVLAYCASYMGKHNQCPGKVAIERPGKVANRIPDRGENGRYGQSVRLCQLRHGSKATKRTRGEQRYNPSLVLG